MGERTATSATAMTAGSASTLVDVDQFGDPGCPFDYGAEVMRWRLAWHYGSQVRSTFRPIVLARAPEEMLERGFDPALQALTLGKVRRVVGMPIDASERARMAATLPACRAAVGVRRRAPEHLAAYMRALRVAAMTDVHALLDDDDTLASAARQVGLESADVLAWAGEAETHAQVDDDARAARNPVPEAVPQQHKMATAGDGRRYTAPTWAVRVADESGTEDSVLIAVGRQPWETYEVLLANCAPGITRREPAGNVEDVLRWAGTPLATREVAGIRGVDDDAARAELAELGARFDAVGNDGWWSLT